jgi:hypothetical protein
MKTGFILHLDSLSVLDELTNEQAGILFKAIRDYNLGKEPELDFAMRMAFLPFKNQFERDLEKYNSTCERNKNNGSKGGRPKKAKETEKTQLVLEKPKKADNKNVNDNKNEKEILLDTWVEYRKQIRKPIKQATIEVIYKKMLEHTFEDCKFVINNSIENGWQGLFWDKIPAKQQYEIDPLVEYVNKQLGLK